MKKVYIDGREGTTGLRIIDRLKDRKDIELMLIDEDKRKDLDERKKFLNSCDIAFLCLPDQAAIEAVSLITNPAVRVIDTSTAHRTNENWVYGFPEIFDSLKQVLPTAMRVAVPGCHASGFIALVAPLVEAKIISNDALLTCFSITGYSGGGKKMIAEYQQNSREEFFDAPRIYGLSQEHKHLNEMQAICKLQNKPIFSPIVSDYYSGMLVNVPLFASNLLINDISAIKKAFENKYQNCELIDVSDISADEVGAMLNSNHCKNKDGMQIYVTGNDDRIVLSSRFDNLGKGSSGAAVECMNMMLGFNPTTGLEL